jgi:predicted DNA-binding protein (UPF0251 family)
MLALGDRESPATAGTEEIEVQELLSHLPEDRRTAFVLTQLTGLSYEDAARACGVPAGTIASRVARARSDLIAALGMTPPTPVDGAAVDGAAVDGHKVRPARRRSIRERLMPGETQW